MIIFGAGYHSATVLSSKLGKDWGVDFCFGGGAYMRDKGNTDRFSKTVSTVDVKRQNVSVLSKLSEDFKSCP